MGSGPPGVCSLLVVDLPWGRCLDLFGGRVPPLRDIASWSSGVAPRSVQAYLRDEIKGRGLRQSDVARRVGISRSQLVNILRGRFGAGPRVILGLKTFADCIDVGIDGRA